MSGSFSLSYPLPEGELYVGCSMPFARASFGGFFNHVAASLLEKA